MQKEKSKKISIIIGLIILILVIAATIVFFISRNKFDMNYDVEEITDFIYFTLYENQKYGVIDKEGNVIIEPEYDVIAIPNPSKPVFICYYDYNNENESYKTKVYNDQKQELFGEYEEVLPLIFQDSSTKVPYEKSVLKYKSQNKYGIMDYDGNKITNADYDSIESLLYKEGYLQVSKNGKYGIINGKGKNIVNIEYDSITADGYYNKKTKYKEAGFVVGNKTQTGYEYGYINFKGEKILDTQYNEVDRVTEIENEKNVYLVAFKNGQAGIYKDKNAIVEHQYQDIEFNEANKLFIVQKGSYQGILNIEGKQILNTEYDYIFIAKNKITARKEEKEYVFDIEGNTKEDNNDKEVVDTENENYFITIDEDEKYGVMDKDNNTIIENKYQYIEYAFNNFFIVTYNGKIGLLDSDNNKKIKFEYDVIQKIENSNVLQAINTKNNKVDIYNKNIENIASIKNAVIYNENNYIEVVSDEELLYLSKEGEILDNKDVLTENSLFAKKESEKWGFVDKNGVFKVDAKYDMVTEFNEYGFAGIKQNGKWGVVNLSGEIVVEPKYKISWQNPQFIGKYCKVNFGYGLDYYTDEMTK